MKSLTELAGIGPALAQALASKGIRTIAGLAEANAETLIAIPRIGTARAEALIAAAQGLNVNGAAAPAPKKTEKPAKAPANRPAAKPEKPVDPMVEMEKRARKARQKAEKAAEKAKLLEAEFKKAKEKAKLKAKKQKAKVKEKAAREKTKQKDAKGKNKKAKT